MLMMGRRWRHLGSKPTNMILDLDRTRPLKDERALDGFARLRPTRELQADQG